MGVPSAVSPDLYARIAAINHGDGRDGGGGVRGARAGGGLTGKNRYPNGYNPETDRFEGAGEYLRIPVLSKWTYNAAVLCERSGISARLSYNRRSDRVNSYNTDPDSGFQYTGNGTYARDRLNFGFSYDINKQFTLSADASNILAKPFRNYVNFQEGRFSPIDVRDEGRYYGLGFRFRFGELSDHRRRRRLFDLDQPPSSFQVPPRADQGERTAPELPHCCPLAAVPRWWTWPPTIIGNPPFPIDQHSGRRRVRVLKTNTAPSLTMSNI